jgi:hypothetical protein
LPALRAWVDSTGQQLPDLSIILHLQELFEILRADIRLSRARPNKQLLLSR